jgi:hypothetical protein
VSVRSSALDQPGRALEFCRSFQVGFRRCILGSVPDLLSRSVQSINCLIGAVARIVSSREDLLAPGYGAGRDFSLTLSTAASQSAFGTRGGTSAKVALAAWDCEVTPSRVKLSGDCDNGVAAAFIRACLCLAPRRKTGRSPF